MVPKGNPCENTPCKWLRKDDCSGFIGDEGMAILGNCRLLGGTAYDRRCELCGSYEGRYR